MFFKKKKEQPSPLSIDYTKWESDFGFLNLIINRKQNATKEFLVGIYSHQKKDTDYLTDEELDPVIERIVFDVLSQISNNYKNFLVEKYFGKEESLVKYITEEVYIGLISDAVNRNYEKTSINLRNRAAEVLSKFNKK